MGHKTNCIDWFLSNNLSKNYNNLDWLKRQYEYNEMDNIKKITTRKEF